MSRGTAFRPPLRVLLEERERLRAAFEAGTPSRGGDAPGPDGLEHARALADAMDAALGPLWEESLAATGAAREKGLALVALGGYGRRELAPFSDVDLMVLHAGSRRARDAAAGVFYPLWDAGFEVGHAVRTPAECRRLAGGDLEAATALLDARLLRGDPALLEATLGALLRRLRRRSGGFLREITVATRARHARAGRAGASPEPHLKEGAGGLRDLQTMGWLRRIFPEAAGAPAPLGREPSPLPAPLPLPPALTDAAELLWRLRIHLHYRAGRAVEILSFDRQEDAGRALGLGASEDPGRAVARAAATAARTVERAAAELIEHLGERRRGRRRPHPVPSAAGRTDAVSPTPALPAAGSVPGTGAREIRERTFGLLAAGDPRALEEFDAAGDLVRIVPEWEDIRCLPSKSTMHRYTVDIHAFETVARLVALRSPDADPFLRAVSEDVADPDLLLLGGLLHDAGKGTSEDHSIRGERIARAAAERLGLGPDRAERLAWLVRHHLLLVHAATRRDLTDETLIVDLAGRVSEAERWRMLFLLTVADALATGAAAWGQWKAALVAELFTKVLHVIERGDLVSPDARELVRRRLAETRVALVRHPAAQVEAHLRSMPPAYLLTFPATDLIRHFALMAEAAPGGDLRMRILPGGEPGVEELLVVAPDRLGLLSTVSGVLAVNGVAILTAHAFTRTDGAALEVFRVRGAFEPAVGPERWARVETDLRRALSGNSGESGALARRIERTRRRYPARAARAAASPARVVVDNAASDFATVVEVHAADRVGLLWAVTGALVDLGLDISVAKVATEGEEVVDVFYVREAEGSKVEDPEAVARIEATLLARLAALE